MSTRLVYKATDVESNKRVILKRIKANTSFFDQSITEIFILEHINKIGSSVKNNFLELLEYFYFNVD